MLLGGVYLLPLAARTDSLHFAACTAFLATGALIFFVSATYHFLADGYAISQRLEDTLENLDHFAIYLFIAGTYSPFLLSAVADPWRLPLLGLIWSIAILGILYTWFRPRLPAFLQSRVVYTGLFVLMGWTLIIRIHEVYVTLSAAKLFFLVAGGVAYSIGAVVYATKKPRLFEGFFGYHELWHLLVLVGAGMHYFMILSFYAPATYLVGR